MNHLRQSKIYRHKFRNQLQTAHGKWSERESIVLREQDENGRVSFGELCPTPGFLSFQLDDLYPIVKDWEMGNNYKDNILISSAISCIRSEIWDPPITRIATKEVFTAELYSAKTTIKSGANIYKKKIGLNETEREIEKVFELFDLISQNSSVRLDANESLTIKEVLRWNEAFRYESRLQFLEQPLPRKDLSQLFELDSNLDIHLALDESLVWKNDLDFFTQKGWNGFFVIKPALFSDWAQTIRFVKANPCRTVVSTVFESPFGFEAVCRCASYSDLIAGVDRKLFNLDAAELAHHHQQPIEVGNLSISMLDSLWKKL